MGPWATPTVFEEELVFHVDERGDEIWIARALKGTLYVEQLHPYNEYDLLMVRRPRCIAGSASTQSLELAQPIA